MPLSSARGIVCGHASVSGHGWIDVNTPTINPARHALARFHALLAQPVHHGKTPHPVVAEDDENAIVRPPFNCLQRGRDTIHRNQFARLYMRDLMFERFPHIDQQERLSSVDTKFYVFGGDFQR